MNRPVWMIPALLAAAWVAETQVLPTPPRQHGQPINRSTASVIALHDAKSRQYNANCLASGCHADIFNRVSLNSTIPRAHNRVELMGIPATQCTFCHQSTEIVRGIERNRGNAGKLGKNVDAERRCYPCHGAYGPAKKLYPR